MTKFHSTFVAFTVVAALALASSADAQGSVRARGQNGSVGAVAGKKGVAGRAAGTTVSSDGTVTRASASGFKGTNGSRGARAATTSVSPDGSVSRTAGASTSGARGSASSQGSFSRNADGTASGARSTSATNAATGNSYAGSTTLSNGSVSHSGTCTNAAGETIACR